MTDQEILLAMANMLEPIKNDMKEVKEEIQILQGDMKEVKADIQTLQGDMKEVKEEIQILQGDMEEVKEDIQTLQNGMQEMQDRIVRIELRQENEIIPRLQNIECCYTSTYDRYKVSVEDHETMKQDISILKNVVAEHSERLQKIS